VADFRSGTAPSAIPADVFKDSDDDDEDEEDEEPSRDSPLSKIQQPAPTEHGFVYMFATPGGVACPSEGSRTFLLDVNLWGEVKEDSVTWKDSSSGRVNVHLEKKAPTKWEHLVRTKSEGKGVSKWEGMQDQLDKQEAKVRARVQQTMNELEQDINKRKVAKEKKDKKREEKKERKAAKLAELAKEAGIIGAL